MNNKGNTNTIILVAILVVLVGFGVWWYKTYQSVAPTEPTTTDEGGIDINIGGGAGADDKPASY